MIYWDNAATTWPKPPAVRQAVGQALQQYGANPGRAGHRMAMDTAEEVFTCRRTVADFFGLGDPAGVIFTLNCTMALNTVIQGVVGNGGRVLVSDLEHNAVVRPVVALNGVSPRYDVAAWSPSAEQTVEHFRRAIRPDTQLMVCTHASNVFGCIFPLRQLSRLAHDNGILFCVDAAQSAGVLSIDMERDGIDYLCIAPHKGLYAPTGTGILLCRERERVLPLVRGGTGSYSMRMEQPADLPDRLESGTPNVAGICGIRAGLQCVREVGQERIYRHELACLQYVYERLKGHPAVRLYTPYPMYGKTVPVLSLNVGDMPSEELAAFLDAHGIAVRAGLHCAPWAHRRFGTLEQGTVRLAPSAHSTMAEAEEIVKVFLGIAEKSLRRQKNMV